MAAFKERFKKAWNVFKNKDVEKFELYSNDGMSYSYRPDRPRITPGHEKTIINSIVNRIAVDSSSIDIKHVKLDENGRYVEEIKSGLNNCLTLEANRDQTGRAFMLDVVMSMLDEGCVAVVPVDILKNKDGRSPLKSESFDIVTLRTGKILEWKPRTIKVRMYDERDGKKKDVLLPKNMVAIIENPFYSIMNEPNSTMQRLIKKLSLLDIIDEKSSADRLDLIVQLPYLVRTDARRKQAEERRNDIERQLHDSKYGIAYTDGTEKITQLNRPVENQLLQQVEYLTNQLYSQLGITSGILDGSADENTMNNYMSRTIEPILTAIVEEFIRKFLSEKERKAHQSVKYFRDPFKLVPVNAMAELADKFTRNTIMTSNEIRQAIGMKPAQDPKADELRNANISQSNDEARVDVNGNNITEEIIKQSPNDQIQSINQYRE